MYGKFNDIYEVNSATISGVSVLVNLNSPEYIKANTI